MRIIVDKSAPNYSQTSAAQPTPSIDKQAAQTTVLVADGDTTVIGGIYNSSESATQDRTPGLHRIPLIGLPLASNSRKSIQLFGRQTQRQGAWQTLMVNATNARLKVQKLQILYRLLRALFARPDSFRVMDCGAQAGRKLPGAGVVPADLPTRA